MNEIRIRNKRYSTIAWGMLAILLGVLLIVPGDQNAAFVFGCGIILLGLNLARTVRRMPVNAFSTTLGFLALGLGTVGLLGPRLGIPPFRLPLFSLLFLVFGLYLLIPRSKLAEDGN